MVVKKTPPLLLPCIKVLNSALLSTLYLTRLLMKSEHFESPTIVFITDRTDLDDQLSGQLTNAKSFIGDDNIKSVESRGAVNHAGIWQNQTSF
jgi:hypothetical protein